jgi:hypothetical protein
MAMKDLQTTWSKETRTGQLREPKPKCSEGYESKREMENPHTPDETQEVARWTTCADEVRWWGGGEG